MALFQLKDEGVFCLQLLEALENVREVTEIGVTGDYLLQRF